MNIGERIEAWCEYRGMTVEQLAVDAEITTAAIYQWKHGLKKKGQPRKRINPSLETLERVTAVLGVSMMRFFGRVPVRASKAKAAS